MHDRSRAPWRPRQPPRPAAAGFPLRRGRPAHGGRRRAHAQQGRPAALTVGGPFRLVDQTGATVTEKALEGAPSLVFFGFTHCPDVCPTALQEITTIYDALGAKGDRLKSFFITVDPERDTPETLKLYLSSFDGRIRGLSGDPAAIESTLKSFRVYARKVPLDGGGYTMDHTALIYLFDKNGRFVGGFNINRPASESARELEAMF